MKIENITVGGTYLTRVDVATATGAIDIVWQKVTAQEIDAVNRIICVTFDGDPTGARYNLAAPSIFPLSYVGH